MKTIQKIGKLILLSAIVAVFASCSDNEPTPFTTLGDAYTVKRVINDEVQYAVSFYAFGNYAMSAATVTLPEGDTVALSAHSKDPRTFMLEASDADFSIEMPDFGQYSFAVVYNNEEFTATDELENVELEIPTVKATEADLSAQSITIDWTADENASAYFVKLIDAENNELFNGELLNNTDTTYTIGAEKSTKGLELVAGEAYTVELRAIVFEESATASDFGYNVEMIAVASKEILIEE